MGLAGVGEGLEALVQVTGGLGLESGTEFVVFGEDGTVVLKVIEAPSMRECDEIVARARDGLRRSDMAESIRAERSA